MSDWWSRKLTNQPAPARQSLPPLQAPIRFPVQVPVQNQQVPMANPASNQRLLDPTRAATDQINMGDAIRLWQGGEAHRIDGGNSCPSCGSGLVFSRGKGSGVMGKQPAPRCFECGWNGLYDQGDQSNWAI